MEKSNVSSEDEKNDNLVIKEDDMKNISHE